MNNSEFLMPKLPYSWFHGPVESRPMSSMESVNTMMVIYLIIVAGGCYYMKNRKPYDTLWLTVPQNFFMCIYSLYAFLGMFETLWRNWSDTGFNLFVIICDPQRKMMRDMDYWMYTFYLSKYIEILDSIVLVLKGKRLLPPDSAGYLLHVYHHSVTSNIVYIGWRREFTVAWVGPATNTFVHFFMYGYYFLVELNLLDRKYGGKFITPIQLLQFILCLSSSIYESIFPSQCNKLEPHIIAWLWFNYVIFFVFFIKIFFQKTSERVKHNNQNKNSANNSNYDKNK